MDTLAKRLKQARKESGMSQDELASKCGMTRGGIGHLETGRRDGTTNIAQIAEALGVNALWLTDGKGPRNPLRFPALEKGIADDADRDIFPEGIDYAVRENATAYSSKKVTYSDGHSTENDLVHEIQTREIPKHIEQSIMALLQTCPKIEAKPTQNSPMFSMEEQRKNIEALRQKLTPEQLRDFDGWLESIRTNSVGGLPSSSVYVAGADPKPSVLPKGKTA